MASKRKASPAEENSGISEIISRFKAHPFLFGGTVVILIIVVIAFVFVSPLGYMERGSQQGGDMVFGYYNGKPIGLMRSNYFEQALRETANMAGFDLQGGFGNYEQAHQVWFYAFVQTLVRMGMLDEMKKAGYTAPSREIDNRVAKYPDFQEDGRFSKFKLDNYDKNRFQALWHNAEENYISSKYMDTVMGMKISSAEKAFIAAMAFPERSFELLTLHRSTYPDTEVRSFAAANPALFRTVHFSRITAGSEREGRQVLESIQSGRSTFEDAARNHSTDYNKDSGGDMGLKMAYEIFSELAEEGDRDKVLSLRQGELSPLLKAPGAEQKNLWVFFRAEENPYAADMDQVENLAKVRSYLNRFEGGRIENWLITRAEAILAGAKEQNLSPSAYVEFLKNREAALPQAALSQAALLPLEAIRTSSFGPVNLNYGNMGGGSNERGSRLFPQTIDTQNNPELSAALSDEHFWRTAFSIPLNTPSTPFTLGDSIAVLTATEEKGRDEASAVNIADFYAMGWMYNTVDADMRGAFFYSSQFENNFDAVFMPMMLQSLVSSKSSGSTAPDEEQ